MLCVFVCVYMQVWARGEIFFFVSNIVKNAVDKV